jgi:hypothetical protein
MVGVFWLFVTVSAFAHELVVIHPRRTDYHGLITGIPERTGPRKAQVSEAAPEPKATK